MSRLGTRVRRLLALLGCALLLLSTPAVAGPTLVEKLIERLEKGEDFRVRVQAALELGKTKSSLAREPLEGALDDDNAAVRTASAAALKVLGDKKAIPALERHKNDGSSAVRTQVAASIAALKSAGGSSSAKLIVKLGKMRTESRSSKLLGDLEKSSREKFGELPGVRVVADGDDEAANGKGKKLPTVMVTGHLRTLASTGEGTDVVYSAKVEYILHRMPGQSIAGTVSGSAKTKTTRADAKRRSVELERLVLAAAVDSAIRRAPEALAAATR